MTDKKFSSEEQGWQSIAEALSSLGTGTHVFSRESSRLRLITQAVERIAAGSDLEDMFKSLSREVRELFGYTHVGVYLKAELGQRQFFTLVAQSFAYEQYEMLEYEQPLDKGVFGRALRTGEVQIVKDVSKDPDYVNMFSDTKSEIVIPLKFAGEMMGVLDLQSRDKDAFHDDDIPALVILANQVATAVRMKETYDNLLFANKGANAVASSLNLQASLSALADVIKKENGEIYMGILYPVEGDESRFTLEAIYPANIKGLQPGSTWESGNSTFYKLLRAPETIVVDLLEWPNRPLIIEMVVQAGFEKILTLPLVVGNKAEGLWAIAFRNTSNYYINQLKNRLEPVANSLALTVQNSKSFKKLERFSLASIRTLVAAVDAKDRYTRQHSENVAKLAKAIAIEASLPEQDVKNIELAGLLHDIGKIGIPDQILNKPAALDSAEQAIMMAHAEMGALILEESGIYPELTKLVRHHHEWWNGRGYPDGLKGKEIPFGAVILAVAEAYDSMTSNQVYRKAMSPKEAIEVLQTNAGTQFCPDSVSTLIKVLNKQGLLDKGHTITEKDLEDTSLAKETVPINSKALAVLYRITEEMDSILDMNYLLNRITHILKEELAFEDLGLLLLDEDTNNLLVQNFAGRGEEWHQMVVPSNKSISGQVVRSGQPKIVSNTEKEPLYYEGLKGVKSELFVPLKIKGRTIGVIVAQSRRYNAFTENDLKLLSTASSHIASVIEVARLHEAVREAASTDSLTGLYNRRYFMERLEEEISRSMRNSKPFSVVMLDVDFLKSVNDTYGHLYGDAYLCYIGKTLKDSIRGSDVIARFGGDEYIIMLPETDYDGAFYLLNRTIHKLSSKPVQLEAYNICNSSQANLPEKQDLYVEVTPSVSFGIASFPADGTSRDELIKVADRRLYTGTSGKARHTQGNK